MKFLRKTKKVLGNTIMFVALLLVVTICLYAYIDFNKLVSANENLIPVNLVKVVDGDTIIVGNNVGEEFKVRLNLINTPESVHEDEDMNSVYGDYASTYTKGVLSGKKILYLQYDKEAEDIYGRKLAYVWLEDFIDLDSNENIENYMLNALIIKNGYGKVVLYNNKAYYDQFKALEEKAIEGNVGLWSYEEYRNMEE